MKKSLDETILEKANSWIKLNQKVVLATVIQTWGSSPRQIGSRMIVNENGDFSGSVSGGCVESNVISECIELIKKNNSFKKIDFKVEDKNVRGTGAKNRGREGGNFSGDQQRNERGEYAFKNKNEVVKEESFSIPKGKETSFADALSGNRDTIHQFLFEERIKSIPPGEGFNDFSGNPAYDSDVDTFLRGLKDSPQGYGIEIDRGRVYLSKEKAVDGGYTIGRDNLPLDKLQESDNAMYGDTFPAGSFSAPKKNTYARAMLEFNEGGVVQKFNQGGEVDTVPAMLTPGEFVVTKDAVKKVGVNTLKGLNASVGATNKPTLMKGTTDSYLGSMSLEFAGFNKGPVEKTMRMTDEGLEKTYFDDTTDIYELSSDDTYFHEKNEMIGSGLSSETIERYKNTETTDDGTKSTFTEEHRHKTLGVDIGVPDLVEHRNQLMSEINKLEGFEKVTFDQFMKKEHGIPQELLLPILYKSDASKATRKKKDRAEKLDREQGVQPLSAYGNSLGYRKNQINPTQYVSFDENMSSKFKEKFSVAKGFNQGGLVTPIIESRDESGEMKLIQSLSQSVNTNRQTLMVMEEQNQAMNIPDQNPNPVALADAPQTAPAELQDTEAPIPFASLLRQSAQRYLNLGNNAMVIS